MFNQPSCAKAAILSLPGQHSGFANLGPQRDRIQYRLIVDSITEQLVNRVQVSG
jgi:hypothetical protein